ncbi:hypothetical protein GIB67_030439 [Kingdonia uniflora]|uniref:Arginine N-methyltransferase 2 n=1 Tax=Kingdonia uniflora TaxID=39325 RepID=A0A7J7NDN3_9MAGN|nr:hypothetical protein GIB67_030439 [Kingdonia uniflora]
MHASKHGHSEAVKILLEAGVPWNALSTSNISAGDFAMDEGHEDAFNLILNAGSGAVPLFAPMWPATADGHGHGQVNNLEQTASKVNVLIRKSLFDQNKSRNDNGWEVGIQAELVLGTIARVASKDGDLNGNYLEDRVSFSEDKLMDSDNKAVMMAWEKPLMEAHANAVCSGGGRILNIGFGMGLVDMAIQRYAPVTHTIIEAHPEVYDRMLRTGWGEKENVKIIFGRWQDVLTQLETFDGKLNAIV